MDRGAVARIVRAIEGAAPIAGAGVLEIGCGTGVVTLALLARKPGRIVGLDIDERRIDALGRLAAADIAAGGLVPVRADARDASSLSSALALLPEPRRVFGSLPYNAATVIVDSLLGLGGFVDGHFLLQREVAERMAAPPSTPAYGYLSVITQLRATVKAVLDVPPSAFRPRPHVHSTLVRIAPKAAVPSDWPRLIRHLSAAFGARRKTLPNALCALNDRAAVERALLAMGYDARARAEELDPASHVRLAARLDPERSSEQT